MFSALVLRYIVCVHNYMHYVCGCVYASMCV